MQNIVEYTLYLIIYITYIHRFSLNCVVNSDFMFIYIFSIVTCVRKSILMHVVLCLVVMCDKKTFGFEF